MSAAAAAASASPRAEREWETIAIPVWWGDMDAKQHVNNCVYVKSVRCFLLSRVNPYSM
jgi:hypothetical protein